jgi:hypothetical protein
MPAEFKSKVATGESQSGSAVRSTAFLSKTPILDSLHDPIGNNIGEMARGALTTLITHSLGRVYWQKAADARSSGDAIASEYWMAEALKKMSHSDKRRNFVD